MDRLLLFLAELDQRKTSFTLHHWSDEAVTVQVYHPGKTYEIEFFEDGRTQVEEFVSSGVRDASIEELLAEWDEEERKAAHEEDLEQ
jgi:hypothetical protein